MNVACDYEAPMQMLTTEKYIAAGTLNLGDSVFLHRQPLPHGYTLESEPTL